ncbi:hypothetical protein Q5752_002288 [Cryptotrichosporon argae]
MTTLVRAAPPPALPAARRRSPLLANLERLQPARAFPIPIAAAAAASASPAPRPIARATAASSSSSLGSTVHRWKSRKPRASSPSSSPCSSFERCETHERGRTRRGDASAARGKRAPLPDACACACDDCADGTRVTVRAVSPSSVRSARSYASSSSAEYVAGPAYRFTRRASAASASASASTSASIPICISAPGSPRPPLAALAATPPLEPSTQTRRRALFDLEPSAALEPARVDPLDPYDDRPVPRPGAAHLNALLAPRDSPCGSPDVDEVPDQAPVLWSWEAGAVVVRFLSRAPAPARPRTACASHPLEPESLAPAAIATPFPRRAPRRAHPEPEPAPHTPYAEPDEPIVASVVLAPITARFRQRSPLASGRSAIQPAPGACAVRSVARRKCEGLRVQCLEWAMVRSGKLCGMRERAGCVAM